MIPAKRKLLRKKERKGQPAIKKQRVTVLTQVGGINWWGRGITEWGVGTSFLSLS